jgi:hypothetical protein
MLGATRCLNVSLVDERYVVRHAPTVIEVDRHHPL